MIGRQRSLAHGQRAAHDLLGLVEPPPHQHDRGEVAERLRDLDVVVAVDRDLRRERAAELRLSALQIAERDGADRRVLPHRRKHGIVGADRRLDDFSGALVMRERFGARNERSCQLRFHTQTAGVSLTAQQPYNNVVRTALQALAGVLGGTNSLHTNSLDEALALPTREAATLALRTQQIIAHETGVTNVVDPLGGSYYVEALTNRLEGEALAYFDRIDRMSGMVAAIEQGFPQREIADSAYREQQAVEDGRRVVVGVNAFVAEDDALPPILYIDESVGEAQLARVAAIKSTRDQSRVDAALEGMRVAARGDGPLMESILDAVRAYATVGEMCDALRDVWGEYQERVEF